MRRPPKWRLSFRDADAATARATLARAASPSFFAMVFPEFREAHAAPPLKNALFRKPLAAAASGQLAV